MENQKELVGESHSLPEPFVRALLGVQDRLYAYLLTLLHDPRQAEEVLQETNVVICRQSKQFSSVNDFVGWACRIAYYEVLTHRNRKKRDRLAFDDRLLAKVAEQAVSKVGQEFDRRQNALDHCLARLTELQRNIIMMRYDHGGSVKAVAEKYGRSVGSISQSLYRIRTALMRCIQNTLVANG